MAGGKLSPRQKMINMMYLVLTAMLALNVSKDILKALTKLDESLETTISTVDAKNQDAYDILQRSAAEKESAKDEYQAALQVKKVTSDLFQYISAMKDTLVVVSGGWEDEEQTIPKALDAKSKPLNYLVAEQGPQKATELREQIEAFRSKMIQLAENDPTISANISKVFSTEKEMEGDKEVSWEQASFGEYPLGAILPFLTDIQARVRNSEAEVLSYLLDRIDVGTVKFNQVNAMVVAPSSYLTQGDVYEARVFLGAYDDSQEPQIEIKDGNGNPIQIDRIENGQGFIKIPATGVGERSWGGTITIKQTDGEKNYPIPTTTYTVAPPSVVISPSKMNVLYRGVDNPLEIGVPGVEPSKVKVSGSGVRQVKPGEYVADVTNIKGTKEIDISVSVEETDSEGNVSTRSVGKKTFRIKGLPPAVGTIYKRTDGLLSANAVANATVEASFQDFVFDLPLTVTKFEVSIPGFPPERVNGNKMPASLKTKIQRLKPGATVTIRNIQAKAVGNPRVKVDRVASISVDVN
ncbi:MAG: gliding motility protein GldM [Bacteroidetes bacterium]|nr:gliding motility protein GldM [Bacteroidota bacterium]